MRLKVITAVATFAVLVPLVGLLAASSVGAAQRQTISVIEHSTNVTYVPLGSLTKCTNTTSCQGDYAVWDDPLFDAKDHARVGTIMGECFVVDTGRLLFHCPGVTITSTGGARSTWMAGSTVRAPCWPRRRRSPAAPETSSARPAW